MINATGIDKGEFLEYKGRPLVRKGNDIYYGDLSDNYHAFMMIMAEVPSAKGVDVPAMILVQVRAKDSTKPERQTTSKSLAEALEIADAWLEKYNK